ncbi:hypothetical protein MMC31_007882, partial [Peltigera leucophlebia]|nr:hypothetical protein [Peltigera leucophlebia]
MVNQKQDPKPSPLGAPLSPINFYDEDDSNEPQAPATGRRSEQGPIASSESSEEEDEVHLPDTVPFGKPNASNYPDFRPQASIPRIRPQIGIPGNGLEQTVIPGIGLQAVIPQTMPKQENLASKTFKDDSNVKNPTATTVPTLKPLSGIGSTVAASRPKPNEESVLSRTLPLQKPLFKFPDIPKIVQHTGSHNVLASKKAVASNILPSNNPQFTATTPPVTENFKFTLDLPITHQPGHAPAEERFSFTQESKARLGDFDFPSVRRPAAKPNRFTHPDEPETPYYIPVKASAFAPEGGASMAEASSIAPQDEKPVLKPQDEEPVQRRPIFPVKPFLAEASTIAPQDEKPVQKRTIFPVKPSLAEASTIAPQGEEPVQRRTVFPVKPSLAEASTIAPQDEESVQRRTIFPVKPSSADAFTATPQTKKRDEEPMSVMIKTSLVEPSIPTHQSKNPAEEPQFSPIKPLLAKPSVPTRQGSQSTEFPQSPAVSSPKEASFKRPTTKDKGRQEETADADKKNQAQAEGVREMLAEKRELRSQRDALGREKAGLETKLQSLNDILKKVEGREEETKKAMSMKSKEAADLKTENERLKKKMEALSLLPPPKPEQEEVSLPVRTGISEKSTVNEDLLAEKAKEIDYLKDTIKQCAKNERDLKASTGIEVLELKAKLRKAEDDLIKKKKDEEFTSKRIERDAKKINDLSDELTKIQLSRNRMETEYKALTVKLNKAKTREVEERSKEVSLEEVEKLRRSLKESEAEAKLVKEQAEKLKKDFEARLYEMKSAKAQNDDLAKDLEESDSRTLIATASEDLKKVENSERGQTSPNRPDETSQEDKQRIRDLSANNEALRKERDEAKRLASAISVEIDELTKAANEQITPLMTQNKTLTETCQGLKEKIAAEKDKLGKLTASNEDLSRKLRESEEVEERAIRKVEEIENIYADVLPVHATNMEQAKQLNALRAKLAEERKAKQKSESLAKLLERKLAVQSASLREVAMERAELISKVSDHEAELAKFADARKSVTVEAELEVTKTMMRRERAWLEEADTKRELNMKTTLDRLEQNERERRQELVEEVEANARLLFEAKKEIRKLNEKVEATEASLATAADAAGADAADADAADADAAAAAAAPPSLQSQSSSSSLAEISPASSA